jgi:hypothetical protein
MPVKKETNAATAATETPEPEARPVPTFVGRGGPELASLRVLDAETGKPIAHVLEADTEKGFVRRFAVEHGDFVREGSNFKVIEEDRKVRLEWIEGAA